MQTDLRTVSITPLRQTYNHIAERQGADGTDLHVGREVIARSKQKPHRQSSGKKGVDRQRQLYAGFAQVKKITDCSAFDIRPECHR